MPASAFPPAALCSTPRRPSAPWPAVSRPTLPSPIPSPASARPPAAPIPSPPSPAKSRLPSSPASTETVWIESALDCCRLASSPACRFRSTRPPSNAWARASPASRSRLSSRYWVRASTSCGGCRCRSRRACGRCRLDAAGRTCHPAAGLDPQPDPPHRRRTRAGNSRHPHPLAGHHHRRRARRPGRPQPATRLPYRLWRPHSRARARRARPGARRRRLPAHGGHHGLAI